MLYIVEDSGTMTYWGPFHSAPTAEEWIRDLSDDAEYSYADLEVKELRQPEEGNE